MSDRVNLYVPAHLTYTDGDPESLNNPNSPPNPLNGTDPLRLHTTDGVSVRLKNKFSGTLANVGDDGDEDAQQASQILQNAGITGFTPQHIDAAETQVNADPQLRAGVQQMSASINTLGDANTGAAGTNSLFTAGDALAKEKNIDIWQLLVVALKGATRDQNEQLRYDLQQLQVLSKVSSQMADYSDVLENAQQRIDDKMAAEKDDKKKTNVEVKLNDTRSYDAGDLTHLLGDGSVNYTDTSDQDPKHRADSDDKHNMVSASGLNVKIQAFTQERDQLQKNIDKRTQKYQSDNENKNQIVAAITAVLKNYYDMMSNTARNTSM